MIGPASIAPESRAIGATLPTVASPGTFAAVLGQATASDEHTARTAATAFVASAFIMPVLATLRESSAAEGPFAPGMAERRFGPLYDELIADRIAGAARFPLVESIVRQMQHGADAAVLQGDDP